MNQPPLQQPPANEPRVINIVDVGANVVVASARAITNGDLIAAMNVLSTALSRHVPAIVDYNNVSRTAFDQNMRTILEETHTLAMENYDHNAARHSRIVLVGTPPQGNG